MRNDAVIVQSEIRRRNLSRTLGELHVRGSLARSELAVRLHLNRSTIASLIAELEARNLVWQRLPARVSTAAPGRPSPVVEICREGPAAVALELSTDWIRAAIIGLGGWVAASTRSDLSLASSTPETAIAEAYELVRQMRRTLVPSPQIVAVGVSAPGAVRARDGFLHHAPNLGWRDVPLGSLVQSVFTDLQVPVFVGNDAELATCAEHLRGSGQGKADFICLWGEGGIGAGIVANGQSLEGAAGYAGEVGHMTIDPNGPECSCGARGCWETLVGERALLGRSGRDPSGGSAAVADLLAAADRGDPRALEALSETGRWLGIGISGLVNIFNPSRVALGGLYARIYPHARSGLVGEIAWRAMRAPRAMVELTTVSLDADALLLGAAELALAPILYDPTIVPMKGDPAPDGTRLERPRSGLRSRGHTVQGGDIRPDSKRRISLIAV
jgi:predicted NBD/HSP70 family sugar kinase